MPTSYHGFQGLAYWISDSPFTFRLGNHLLTVCTEPTWASTHCWNGPCFVLSQGFCTWCPIALPPLISLIPAHSSGIISAATFMWKPLFICLIMLIIYSTYFVPRTVILYTYSLFHLTLTSTYEVGILILFHRWEAWGIRYIPVHLFHTTSQTWDFMLIFFF